MVFSLQEKHLEGSYHLDGSLVSPMTEHRSGTERVLQSGWPNSCFSKALAPSLGKLRVVSSSPEGAKRQGQLLGEVTVHTITHSPPGGTTVSAATKL